MSGTVLGVPWLLVCMIKHASAARAVSMPPLRPRLGRRCAEFAVYRVRYDAAVLCFVAASMPYLQVQDGSLQLAPQLGLELVVAGLLEVLSHKVQVPVEGMGQGRAQHKVRER